MLLTDSKINVNKNDCYTHIVQGLLVWLVFQDFILAILYKAIPDIFFIKIFFHLKDALFLLLMFVSFFFKRKKNTPIYCVLLFYFLFCFFMLALTLMKGSDASLTNVLASFRSSILLPGMILIGLGANQRSMEKFFEWYALKFITFVALFGLLDYFLDRTIGTIPFWTDTIGFGDYLKDIKNNVLINGLPGNFYGEYGGGFFTQKRLVGFWGTPLTSGYGLLMSVLFSFVCFLTCEKKIKKRKLFVIFIINFSALLLTFTRAIILPAVFLLVLLLLKFRPKYRGFLVCFLLISLSLLLAFLGEKMVDYIYDGSTMEHIRQVTDSLSQVSAFGSGYASFGIYSEIGTESTYITIVGEIGILGLLLFVTICLISFVRLFSIYEKKSVFVNRSLLITLILASFVYFFTGLLSEQLTAYTTIAPFGVFLGAFQFQTQRIPFRVVKICSVDELPNNYERIIYAKNESLIHQ